MSAFLDDAFILLNSADQTKRVRYDVSGVTTATTRSRAISNYSGVEAVSVGAVSATGQTANMVATIVTGAGVYLITIYHLCTTAGTTGNLATTVSWTDNNAAQTIKPAVDISLGVTGYAQGMAVVRVHPGVTEGVDITATMTGVVGNPQYALYARCVPLA